VRVVVAMAASSGLMDYHYASYRIES